MAAAQSGDVIKVAPGNYVCSSFSDPGSVRVQVNVALLTIEAEVPGSFPYFDMKQAVTANLKVGGAGHLLQMGPTCTNLTIRGLRIKSQRHGNAHNAIINGLSGYQIGGSGAHKSHTAVPYALNLEYCELIESTNGMLIGPNWNGVVNMTSCVVTDCSAGDQSHGVYISEVQEHNVVGCLFRTTTSAIAQANAGHLLKSRAEYLNVRACMFDPRIGGSARCIDYSSGGHLDVRGCVMFKPDTPSFSSSNMFIAFGPEQRARNKDFARDGRTHSMFLAQNTFDDRQKPKIEILKIYNVQDQLGGFMSVAQTVRNNVVASVTASATDFVATYPNNSVVPTSVIDPDGRLTISLPAGSATDANLQFSGALQTATPRGDSLRGAYSSGSLKHTPPR